MEGRWSSSCVTNFHELPGINSDEVKDAAPKHTDFLPGKVQDQNITASGTWLVIVQAGGNEKAEATDHCGAPTEFPAAYTGGSVTNRLGFLSKP